MGLGGGCGGDDGDGGGGVVLVEKDQGGIAVMGFSLV